MAPIDGVLIILVSLFATDMPAELAQLERRFANLATGDLNVADTDYALAERRGRLPRELFKTFRFGDQSLVVVHRGDVNGVVNLDTSGQPSELLAASETYEFYTPGQRIMRIDAPNTIADIAVLPADARADIRTLGLASTLSLTQDIHQTLRMVSAGGEVVQYSERSEGPWKIIESRCGSNTRTYWLDPEKADSPVRVRDADGRGGWVEAKFALSLQDGVWFPAAVEYYTSAFRSGESPARTIRVISARFNDPNQPSALSSSDIGLYTGMLARVIDSGEPRVGRWDGKDVLSEAEFTDKRKQGLIRNDPRYVSAEKKRQSDANTAAMAESDVSREKPDTDFDWKHVDGLWEKYVRDFISRHELNADQTAAAQSVLRDCQNRAKDYVTRKRSDIEALTASRDELAQATTPDPGRARKISEAEAQLRKPIEDIFDQQLKPRLEKIPTRAQKKKAAG